MITNALGPTAPPDLPMLKWAKRETGYLPTRDGTMLKYSVLLPAVTGRFPVIVNYSGYDAGSIGGPAFEAGNSIMSPSLDQNLLAAGYAVMGVNMAGTACSDGVFDLFGPRWATDGYDLVEWAAQQAWSDGNVGMANWSYAGLSQFMTAIERPPHLRAIAPGMLVTDPWRDVGYPGGVTNYLFPTTWWLFIQTRWAAALQSAIAEGDARCIANVARNEVVAQPFSPISILLQFPYPEGSSNGSPMAERVVRERAAQIEVPVLSVVSWQDESTGPRGGYFETALDPEQTYLIGMNGPHDTYASKYLHVSLLRFFDRYVKGIDNGFDREPRVQLWHNATMDASLLDVRPRAVVSVDRLPVRVRPLRLALRDGGVLSTDAAQDGEAAQSYSYPIQGPAVNGLLPLGVNWTRSTPSARGALSYTTPPLTETLTFYGPASADLWVSSSRATDADVQVTLTEVRADGREEYVQRGWLRLSQRALDAARSTPTRPYLTYSSASAEPLMPGEPVLARVEINRFSHVFHQGSSIRIWLDTPSPTGGWDFQSPVVPTRLTVHHDAAHPSALVLGLLQRGGYPLPPQACGSNLYQPCRANPVAVPVGRGLDGASAGDFIDAP